MTTRTQTLQGLSPRVRGILLDGGHSPGGKGSIPACTGNPRPPPLVRWVSKVYPRVYGESSDGERRENIADGLSPRVRGIRCSFQLRLRDRRSIPACTGNPLAQQVVGVAKQVYPRVYGESDTQIMGTRGMSGLSPRVRGIRIAVSSPRSCAGSIPACTGNPTCSRRRRPPRSVYPRVYGESPASSRLRDLRPGLSPRVRGIPAAPGPNDGCQRSIPACTGNPGPGRRR